MRKSVGPVNELGSQREGRRMTKNELAKLGMAESQLANSMFSVVQQPLPEVSMNGPRIWLYKFRHSSDSCVEDDGRGLDALGCLASASR